MAEVSVIVLAGGKSRRLSVDKALLELDGELLLQRIVHSVGTISDDLLVVGNEREELAHVSARIVPDAWPGAGPLGGVYSGLQAMLHWHGLVVACDMPLLNLELLRYMVTLSEGFDVVIPRIGEKTEPLHAIYSKACLQPIESLLHRGELRIIGFLSQGRVRFV